MKMVYVTGCVLIVCGSINIPSLLIYISICLLDYYNNEEISISALVT